MLKNLLSGSGKVATLASLIVHTPFHQAGSVMALVLSSPVLSIDAGSSTRESICLAFGSDLALQGRLLVRRAGLRELFMQRKSLIHQRGHAMETPIRPLPGYVVYSLGAVRISFLVDLFST